MAWFLVKLRDNLTLLIVVGESHDSSVGIALGYALDDRPGSGAHPASYPMDTRGSFPAGKAAGA